MSFAQVTRVLVVLAALCACTGREDADGPLLPMIELPSTTVGVAYEVRLNATGGVPPLRYSVGAVPPGFSFYSDTAVFTGPATAEGDSTLTMGVTDATGAQDSRTYALRVYAVPSITSVALPQATSGQAYEFLLGATGGQPPLRWALENGALPPRMTLLATGNVSGTAQELGSHPFTARVQDANGAQATRQLSLEVRSSTTAFPLKVGTWNIEWFGSTSNGPTDDQLQLNNVRTVLQEAGVDFWGLEEIVDVNQFNALKQGLPGYDGFVANDARVTNGTTYYSTGEQKVAVLYKSDVVQVLSASVILGDYNFEFGTRPPLRVDLRVTRGGSSLELVALVLHMKAQATQADYDRRQAAGVALQQYVEAQLPTSRVIILGDWNDDADVSIVRDTNGHYLSSPYQNFVDAPGEYTFLTRPLSLANVGSTVGWSNVIDHQLVTNELAADYVSNSATVLRPAITNYGSTTSDHYPVTSRFDFSP